MLKSFARLKTELRIVGHDGQLSSLQSPYLTTRFLTNVPRVGLEGGGISITEPIYNGILYKVKLDLSQPVGQRRSGDDVLGRLITKGLMAESPDALYVLKSTYPQRRETHGTSVHILLAKHAFAPAFYLEFAPPFEDAEQSIKLTTSSKPSPLIRYHLMEFLSPPTKEEPGWVTLDDFVGATDTALLYKDSIKKTLKHIIEILQQNEMVHGDMRPNNIMIRVKVSQDYSIRPLFRQGTKLIDIRLIDFDWAGKVGKVRYPAGRNPLINYWPGEDSQLIMGDDDKKMVDAWMETWGESRSIEEEWHSSIQEQRSRFWSPSSSSIFTL